jgi:hypothetical protein
MAEQKGIIPLKGTIGNITFFKTKSGARAREKSGIDANRIKNDPAFERTRENGAEFGRAGKATKLLRTAFQSVLLNISDSYMFSRMVRDMMKVIQADATNQRGQRNVIDGEAELLTGFNFNANASLGSTLFAPFTPAIDRATGALKVDLPSFLPVNMVAAPKGATHFKIITAGAAIDFEAGAFVNGNAESTALPINGTATEALSLAINLTANSTHPLFLAMGILFYQEVNGTMYGLKNGAFNALSLVSISGAVPPPPGP